MSSRQGEQKRKEGLIQQLDWFTILVPLSIVLVMAVFFMVKPDESAAVLEIVRGFLGDDFGLLYAVTGIGTFMISMYLAFSKYGKIKLGSADSKPEYSSFKWGTMIFTSTMGADILFYSLCEWSMYAGEEYIQAKGVQEWASTYPFFHWGPIVWSFYIVLSVAFGFMLHVRGREKQRFSEACRPLLGKGMDGWGGRLIDFFAIFALLCGAATTFSLATPLMSDAVCRVFGFPHSPAIAAAFLLVIALVYTVAVLLGMKGIQSLASLCTYFFLALIAYFLFFGGEMRYILETAFQSIGNIIHNFIPMATYIDPLRTNSFPQNWTIYYWAYWLVYCSGTPFFLGQISKGRTIRQTILGSYAWALSGTAMSFMVLGNYGLAQQLKHGLDVTGFVAAGGTYSQAVIRIFDTMPLSWFGLILLVIAMVAFYSTTFDAITLVIASYSYKRLENNKTPDRRLMVFWAVTLILMPLVLIFREQSLYCLQSVTIIGAAPIAVILIMIIWSFFRDAGSYLREIGWHESVITSGQSGKRER